MDSEYIGDGVYARSSLDGEVIVLTERWDENTGNSVTHWIAFEPAALQQLVIFARRKGWRIS